MRTVSQYRFSDEVDTAIVKFCADLARTLNVLPWTIGLAPIPPPKDDEDGAWSAGAFAMVEPVPHRRLATVYVCDDFLNVGHKDILMTLVHELCHLYLIGLKQTIDDQGPLRCLSVGELNQITMRHHHEEEMAVDMMANAWTDVMWEWPDVQKGLSKITKQVERSVP